MWRSRLRENLSLITIVVVTAGPVLVVARSSAALRILGMIALGLVVARLLQLTFRLFYLPPTIAAVPGAIEQFSPGPTRRAYLIPTELPPPPRHLIGRDAEIDEILIVLGRAESTAGPTVISISGPAGLGKSALAVTVAHMVSENYPDGQ